MVTTESKRPQAVRGVRDAQRAIEQAEQCLVAAVQRLRSTGASWAEVGRALGVTPQSAHERFAKAVGAPV